MFFSVANLLNLEVDLIFLDTTTTYFEVENEDEDTDQEEGLRKCGHDKNNHPELPQIVIAFVVTRDGIPVRCWVCPSNKLDQDLRKEVKKNLNDWRLVSVSSRTPSFARTSMR